MCGWVFLIAVREVGRRCFAGQDVEVQAQLDKSVAALDRYVMRNSKMSAADVARFHVQEGKEGAPEAQLCHGDLLPLYRQYRSMGAREIRAITDAMVSRPGPPTYGDTCV